PPPQHRRQMSVESMSSLRSDAYMRADPESAVITIKYGSQHDPELTYRQMQIPITIQVALAPSIVSCKVIDQSRHVMVSLYNSTSKAYVILKPHIRRFSDDDDKEGEEEDSGRVEERVVERMVLNQFSMVTL